MRNRIVRTFAGGAAALLLLGSLAGGAVADGPDGVGPLAVCIKKDNGQVRVLADGESCGPSEKESGWQVDGEITDVVTGPGLRAHREVDTIHLDIEDALINSQDRLIEGRGHTALIPASPNVAQPLDVGHLPLPAGAWHIVASISPGLGQGYNPPPGTERHPRPACRLQAGNDVAYVQGQPMTGGFGDDTLFLQVTHRFTAPGEVILQCNPDDLDDYYLHDPRIVAREATLLEQTDLVQPD